MLSPDVAAALSTPSSNVISVMHHPAMEVEVLTAPRLSYDVISEAVGGPVQFVTLHDDLLLACNEEGKCSWYDLPVNYRATALAEFFHPGYSTFDVIVGDCFVVRIDGATGDYLPLAQQDKNQVAECIGRFHWPTDAQVSHSSSGRGWI